MFASGVPDLLGFRHSSERVLYRAQTTCEEHCLKRMWNGFDVQAFRGKLFMSLLVAVHGAQVLNLLWIWVSKRLTLLLSKKYYLLVLASIVTGISGRVVHIFFQIWAPFSLGLRNVAQYLCIYCVILLM